MSHLAIRLTTMAIFSMALIALPSMTPAFASAGDPPPASDTKEKKKKSHDKGSSIDQRIVSNGYRTV